MKKYVIYKATNLINGKCYIGFTSNWPKRMYIHIWESKKKRNVFHKALCKYGKENFKWEIVYESTKFKDTLKNKEPYYIKQYNTLIPFGYNMSTGGDGGPKLYGKANGMYGRTHTLEARQKMSKNRKRLYGKDNPMYNNHKTYKQKFGTLRATEIRQKKSKSMTGKKLKPLSIEHKQRLADIHSYEYVILTPEKKRIKVKNLTKFCRDNNLNLHCMRDTFFGRQTFHRGGYRCEQIIKQ